MSSTDFHRIPLGISPIPIVTAVSTGSFVSKQSTSSKKLHRIATIRRSQEMPIHHCAKRLGISVAEAERQEEPTTDLTLTQLRAWQEVLDAPLSEILAPGTADLENPVRNRALLVKVMKTARQIQETARESRILSIAGTLVDQLIEVMPELDGISAWPDVGQSHENRELGRTAIRRFEVVLPRRTNP